MFSHQDKFSLDSLEHGLLRAVELNKHFEGVNVCHALAAGFKPRGGDQGGLGRGHGDQIGKRDGSYPQQRESQEHR